MKKITNRTEARRLLVRLARSAIRAGVTDHMSEDDVLSTLSDEFRAATLGDDFAALRRRRSRLGR